MLSFFTRQQRTGQKLQHKSEAGFTLVEAMVAVTVLAVAIIGPITLAQRSIRIARDAESQLTAEYLAIEAIELARYVRDNYSAHDTSAYTSRNNWVDDAGGRFWDRCKDYGCVTRVRRGYQRIIRACDASGCLADNNSKIQKETASPLYAQGTVSGATQSTTYRRWLTVENADPATMPGYDVNHPKREIKVTAHVRWTNSGVSHEIAISEVMLNWFPCLPTSPTCPDP